MRWIQNADIFPFLRVKHPNEDPENLSQHGTIGISQMFGKAADTASVGINFGPQNVKSKSFLP